MARNKLTDRQCRSLPVGFHSDGGNLYLIVGGKWARSWIYRYTVGKKQTDLGLGPYPAVSLALARERALELNTARAMGIDPKTTRDQRRGAAITFGECAERLLADLEPGWSNANHRYHYRRSLIVEAAGLAEIPIGQIGTDDVLRVLKPLWLTRVKAPDTRMRIEKVLDWAKAKGYRQGENPARWRGHLDNLLPKRNRIRRHMAAMPYSDVPAFLTKLRATNDYRARALELLILTAGRTNEMLGARWDEFDLDAKMWTIPAERMKMRREHRVPLSDRAVEILSGMFENHRSEYVVPHNQDIGRPAYPPLLSQYVKLLGCNFTVHGFRSSFRDWAAERTSVDRDVTEMALAHTVGNAVEQAYRRTDWFEKRRDLMDRWAAYCNEVPGKVITLRR